MCLNQEIRLRFLGIHDKRTMDHLNVKKIGLDTDEEEPEEPKPKANPKRMMY